MTELSPWMTITQVAEHCGVDRAHVYSRLLPQLIFRRIGVRGGVAPMGRIIRIERSSVLQLCGETVIPTEVLLPRWVTLQQAGRYYQVSPHLIRRLIAHQQLDARRIGNSRSIRIDRDSLLQLGQIRAWWAS